MEGGNSDGHEPWNNAIRRIEIIFRGCWSVVELLTAKRKKNKTEKRRTVSWEGGGERKKKKTEKEMKTKPLDRIVFRANVQYLDGWILSRSCRCFIFKHSQKLAGLSSKIYRREPPPPGAEQTREGRTKVQPRWSFLIKSDLGSLVFELENWFQRWERENCSRQPDDSS